MDTQTLAGVALHLWIVRRGVAAGRLRDYEIANARDSVRRAMRQRMRGDMARGRGNKAWRRADEVCD